MKTQKMSFKNIKDVLSRDEMKSIMAGSGGGGGAFKYCIAGGVQYACGGSKGMCVCSVANSTTNNC